MSPLLALGGRRRHPDLYGPPVEYPLPTSGALVSVPTYDGSGRSTHPSVVDMGLPWNGYRWWFADTPYPNENDQLENPSIFASNDRAAWVVPPGLVNPLEGPPAGGFNSDVDLAWDADARRLVLYWRDYVSARTPQMYLRRAYSYNGIDWTIQPRAEADVMSTPWQSPMVSRVTAGQWRLWRFGNTDPPGMWTGPSSVGPWTFAGTVTLTGYSDRCWHGDITLHDGQWRGVFSDTYNAYPFVASPDGLTWTVGAQLFSSYRPTLCPSTEAGFMDVWTSTTAEYIYYHRTPVSTWTALA